MENMSAKYSHVLSPLVVRGHVLKNRLEVSNSLPHFLQGNEPFPAESVITHYANKAKAGAAIVTCMGINNFSRGMTVPMEADFTHFPDYDLYNPACQNYLMQMADAIHYHGSIACMGIFVGPPSGYPLQKPDGTLEILRLSDIANSRPITAEEVDPHNQLDGMTRSALMAMQNTTKEHMDFISESLAQQTKILRFLGFDMVSIHLCYRGQLPTQFLSPLTNHRTDEYGGSLENRARFPLECLKKVREAAGRDMIVEILFSGEEPEGGYTMDEGVEFLKMAEPYVDIVQFRAGEADPNHPIPFELDHTPFLKYAANAKAKGLKMKVACVGGFHYFDDIEAAVASGSVDIVSAARAFLSNPDYGQLLQESRAEDLVPCLRCNKCHGRGPHDTFVSVCSVNPKIGIEHRLDILESKPLPSMKIAVIGGGPAGMKAAMDLSDRGHKVTIYEAQDHLGGAIYHADFVPFKWTLKDFKNYLIRQVEKRPIDIKLNTHATPAMVEAEGFDMVISALGAQPAKPPIPGLDKPHVMVATESMIHPETVGHNVVVIGGGEVGVEAGMNLAALGHEVTVLEMTHMLAPESTAIHYYSMFKEAWEKLPSFHSVVNATVTGVEDDKVTYKDKDGVEHAILCDSVVISLGMKPLQEEALSFSGSADRFAIIGDCKKPATVQQAMRQAYAVSHSV
jgi:2,4-dienoyl-CoA reductase-like NADH-dependent reductase (Old Yellow Enzyme family)/thioredoxin reductase